MSNIACVKCKSQLSKSENQFKCNCCRKEYPLIDGIGLMLTDVDEQALKQKQIYDSSYSEALEIFACPVGFYDSKSLTIGKYIHFVNKYIEACKAANIEILEIGAGGGQMLGTINQLHGLHPYGIDISIGSAKLVSKSKLVNPDRIAVCDASCLCFPDNFFDIVYTFGTLEHLEKPGRCIAEINRVLKDDGIMITFCPVSDFKYTLHWLGSIFNSKAQSKANLAAGHDFNRILTKSELIDIVEKSGFSIVETLPWDILFQPIYDYKIITAGKKLRNMLRRSKYKSNANVVTQIVTAPSRSTTILKKIFYPFAKLMEVLDSLLARTSRGASLFIAARKKH